MADFAPHTLVSNPITNQPYYAYASSNYASTNFQHNAFDGASVYWLGTGGGVDWLALDLGDAFYASLTSYSITVNTVPEPLRAPKNWTMEGSNDGSSWTVLDTRTNQSSWTSGENRVFTITASANYRYFRLNITANNGDATYTQVQELYLFGTAGGSSTSFGTSFGPHDLTTNTSHSPYVASSSTAYNTPRSAFAAFDGSVSLGGSWLGTGSGVDWLQLDVGSGNTFLLNAYRIYSDDELPRAPKTWTMQGSNDGTTWTVLDTRSAETAWHIFESRVYVCATRTTAYRYFRLNITANNGDATYTQVAELYLYSGAAVGGGGVIQPCFFVYM